MLRTLRNPNSKACNTYNEKMKKRRGFLFQNILNEDLKITKSIWIFKIVFIEDL
jgi:hypothetical protein